MKRHQLLAGVLMLMMAFAGCKKNSEKVIDCFGESLLVSVHATASSSNIKEVATEVRYSGTKKVSSVKWEYGDGATEVTTGLAGKHIYASAGTYTIKARVSFTEGKSSCEVDPTKSVVIQ